MNRFLKFYEQNKLEIIFNVALLEDIECSKQQVQTILDIGTCTNVSSKEIKLINNLQESFKELFKFNKLTPDFMEEMNGFVTEGLFNNPLLEGQFRTVPVTISNSTYVPKVMNYAEVFQLVETEIYCLNNSITLESILLFYIRGMKNQYFHDGNKRTMFILVNQLLIENELGFLILPAEQYFDEYFVHLKRFYENETYDTELIEFIKQTQIKSLD